MRNKNMFALAGAMTVLLGLSITGCANPVETLINKGAESALEKLAEAQGGNIDLDLNEGGLTITGQDGETYGIGAGASVPDTWPDMPLPAGEVISAITQGNTHSLTFTSTQAELDALLSTLKSSGFEESGSMDMGDLKLLMLSSDSFDVHVGGIAKDGDDTLTIQYTVTATQ